MSADSIIKWLKSLFKKPTPEVKKEPETKTIIKKVKVPIHSWRIVIQEHNYEHEISLKSTAGRRFLFGVLYAEENEPNLLPYQLNENKHFYTFKLQDYELTLPKEAIKAVRIFNPVPAGEEEIEIREEVPV